MARQRTFQRRRLHLLLALVASAASLSGCTTAHYLVQAGLGQLRMSNRARPVEEVIADPRVESRTREMLRRVEHVKLFGQKYGLRPTSNYTTFVQLEGTAAVWVVSACEELEFKPRSWSFPIAGSFTYLGWFDRKNAEAHADDIRKEGLDVWVRGASAYSTLGWFRDPVYSSMIRPGDDGFGFLANTVLHEGVHDTVYVDGQSYFNESVASFFADDVILDYFKSKSDLEAERKAYLSSLKRWEENRKVLHDTYVELDALYGSKLGDVEKRARKKSILSGLKKKLGTEAEHNNASLIQYKTYSTGTEDFESLLNACGRDWKRFLRAVGTLEGDDFPEHQTKNFGPTLRKLAQKGC